MYLPEHNLVIEVYEKGCSDRDEEEEKKERKNCERSTWLWINLVVQLLELMVLMRLVK